MDIRGRSNYPFRAPLTGPRIIPPSGRPCVGLTRLSSDRVAERRRELGSGGGARGYGFGRAASKRKDRGRGEAASERASERVGPEGRQRRRRVPEGVRRTVGGRERSSSGSGSSTAATAGGRRGVGKTWSRGLLQSLRGQRESAAPAARSLARLLAQPSPSSPPSALATHTRVLRRRVRMHARIHKRAGPRRGVQFRARTHACTPCCRNRGYSRPRKRENR